MNTSKLMSYLPLHSSTTLDLCINSWTATGNPIIKNGKLFLDGSSYLTCDQQWLFAGQDFSVGCRFSATSNTTGGVVCLWQMYIGTSNRFHVSISTGGYLHLWKDSDRTVNIHTTSSVLDGQEHYTLAVYSSGTWFLFLDGQLVGSKAHTFDSGIYTLYLGRNMFGNRKFTGYIDEFMLFYEALHTENFTPPTDDELFAAEVELAGYAERFYDFDTSAQIDNAPLLNSATKVWLTADNYPTEDIAGNLWHAYNNPTTSNGALQLSGVNQWLMLDGGITLGGKDFTIRGKFNMSSASGSYAYIFNIHQSAGTHNNQIGIDRNNTSNTNFRFLCMGSTTSFNCTTNVEHDFEVSYAHADKTFRCFVDGVLVATKTYTLNQTTFANCWLGRSNYATDGYFAGTIDEFQIIDGIALHTQDFIPMTVAEIDALKADFNARYSIGFSVQNQIDNAPLTWRYENAGFASLVLPDATTLNNLPATQSKTSVAFYQTAQSKSFDCDPAKTIWIKFDLYHQGGNAFRVYSTSNGKTGIYRSSNTRLQLYSNGTAVLNIDNVLATNTLQTWLLRMTSGVDSGAIELWCDGVKCGEYIGNVNNDVDFGNIYLQSDGAKNLFSNVIVSNGEISFSEILSTTFNVENFYDVEFNARNSGFADWCTVFTGKPDRAKIPDEIFNSSTEFTVEVRIATADTHSNDYFIDRSHIFGSYDGFSTGNGINLALNGGNVQFWQKDAQVGDGVHYYVYTDKFVADGDIHKIIVRSNADSSLDIFVDDVLISHTDNFGASLKTGGAKSLWFANDGDTSDYYSRINLFEVRFWDKALADDEIFSDIDGTEENLRAWYLPTPDGLKDFSANMFHPTNYNCYFGKYQAVLHDVEYEIVNDALIWRYEDGVIYNGTGLPIKFHLPATYELWARFDVTFDGVNYWYAFSGEIDDMTGVGAANESDIDYIADNVSVQTLDDVLQKHRAQSFLLHLLSGIDDGKIELWISNTKQEIFTGNVNGGEPFTDFNLLCNGGTFFSNIIVSNISLEPEEKVTRQTTQFTAYNSATHAFYLGKGGTYPNSITYSVQNVVNHITEIDVTNINEIWAKFDATSDGVNRWWFYNDDGFGQNGITAQIDGSADFIADDETVQTQTDAITLNQTQSYIVHMISDAENGLIELRVKNGGTYTYTGNVNGGEAFDEIWLRSESRQVVFGNYILSTSPLNFDADVKVDVDGEPLTKIFFNVRHNGDVIKIPFVADVSSNAVVIRWLKQNWYNPLTSSGDISLRLGSVTQALTSEL